MSPMFDPAPSLFGVPGNLLSFGIGTVGMLIGVSLVRRAAGGSPEAKAFRATVAPPVDRLRIVGVAAVAILIAFVAYLALWR